METYIYESEEASTTHSIDHYLDTFFLDLDVWILDKDSWVNYNDDCTIIIENNYRITIELTAAENIKVIIIKEIL